MQWETRTWKLRLWTFWRLQAQVPAPALHEYDGNRPRAPDDDQERCGWRCQHQHLARAADLKHELDWSTSGARKQLEQRVKLCNAGLTQTKTQHEQHATLQNLPVQNEDNDNDNRHSLSQLPVHKALTPQRPECLGHGPTHTDEGNSLKAKITITKCSAQIPCRLK